MQLTADKLKEHDKYAIAYHPDGDGYGTINILLNHIPNAQTRLYSVDNSMRDFCPSQYTQLKEDIANGYRVIYLDLTPSNIPQLKEINGATTLLYLDHHQIPPGFMEMFEEGVHHHNPRVYDPDNAELYAAGLQIFNLFGQAPKDHPYLLISLFGDAKFDSWPDFQEAEKEHQSRLAEMANALSIVGLTKPLGPYNPQRTDDLFDDVIQRTRAAYEENKTAGLLAAFEESRLHSEYIVLKKQIELYATQVKRDIEAQTRLIEIDDTNHALVAMLLKDAYNKLDFSGPYVLYQKDEKADLVHYAVMSKHSTYNCAGVIRSSPFVTGGGHTDRAGCTSSLTELTNALNYFLQEMES
ncbi:MAG TPA: hypothetical protein DCE42_08310 [Myxococcales bacterium]|nr:hypothetical protein [Deltaproteobacteria bacterium]MBU52687.1 hypothetical protein [Deltaproteobacteria bacterium]HAA54747.1 hypothetical protein [Myxococcales bacterium]|tara:strand:+ start:2225 stop:3286 length:1062 start_codon:yes stop_codon:yes gene_type:complete